MISLRDSLSDLDRSHKVRLATLECYVSAIRTVARYAVDLDDKLTGPYRRHLEALAAEVAADKPEVEAESRATLRNLLRDYRDKAAEFIGNLRKELATSAGALEKILSTLTQTDGDNDSRLRVSIASLRTVADSPIAAAVRPAIFAAVESFEETIEEMRKQHGLTVSQLQVEIQMLHRRIDELQTAAMIDNLTKLLTRAEMEERIRGSADEWFSLLLIRVTGLRSAESRFNASVAAEMTGAFGKRLRNCVPPKSVIGRWSHEEFIAKMLLPKREAIAIARGVTDNLAGAYSCLDEGKTVRPSLQINVAVLERELSEPIERTFVRIAEFFKA